MSNNILVHENICERRIIGYENLIKYLKINDWNLVNDWKEAKVILFYSCGMKEMDTKNVIKDYANSGKLLIVFGCAPKMLNIEDNDQIRSVALKDIDLLDELLQCRIKYSQVNNCFIKEDMNKRRLVYNQAIKSWDPRLFTPMCKDVYSVKISDGCSNDCSYCAIHNATGTLKSRSVEEIVKELQNALNNGYKHFRIQCENSGSYGEDISSDIGILLDSIASIEREFDIDIPDLHPEGFVKHIDKIIKFVKRKSVYQIHLPIQSGSQKILNLMNRRYDINKVKEALRKLFLACPNAKIGTDIIIGFPDELDEDFQSSYDLVKEFNFEPLYIHGYCDKEGTLASTFTNKVNENSKAQRIEKIYMQFPYVACYLNNYRELDNI